MTSPKDLRDMPDRDLAEHITRTPRPLRAALPARHRRAENTAGLRDAKRELARALTIANERERERAFALDDASDAES